VTSEIAPLSGRRREAQRNDARLLPAAREVLARDPRTSMAELAEQIGMGIGTLYRRYPSKEALLADVCASGMQEMITLTEAELDDSRDSWAVFESHMLRSIEHNAGSLMRFTGMVPQTEELQAFSRRMSELTEELLDRAEAAGALRPDITAADISLILEQVHVAHLTTPERDIQLRRRYLQLTLDSLRAPAAAPLPGPAPLGTSSSNGGAAADDDQPTLVSMSAQGADADVEVGSEGGGETGDVTAPDEPG
jgi:AcrR family transcriptional regulator